MVKNGGGMVGKRPNTIVGRRTAAAILAEGKTVEEVAVEVGRSPQTIRNWLQEPEFQASMLRGIRGQAVLTLSRCVQEKGDPKGAQGALAILRLLGAGGPFKTPRGSANDDDETGLGGFSREQLERMEGDG